MRTLLYVVVLFATIVVRPNQLMADEIKVQVDGEQVEVVGVVKHENHSMVILETSDGMWQRLAKEDIKRRTAKPPPAPMSPEQLGNELREKFGEFPHLRLKVTPDVIVLLVLEAQLPREGEARVENLFKTILNDYRLAVLGVEQFSRQVRVTQRRPSYPAIVVICESAKLADELYEADDLKLPGVAALFDCGWYDPSTNRATFSLEKLYGEDGTPADVLIWQQLFHTGMLQRQAPVPLWFLHGIAAGFDWIHGRNEPDHLKLSPITYPGLLDAKQIDWDKLTTDYEFWESDHGLSFEDFRDQSWALHWYLIREDHLAYFQYWKTMSGLLPLDGYETDKTLNDFKRAFGKNPNAFKPLFNEAFKTASQVPPENLHPEKEYLDWSQNYGGFMLFKVKDVIKTTNVKLEGRFSNVSPLRMLSFVVGVETDRGRSAVWFVDNVEPSKTVPLKALVATKPTAPKGDQDKVATMPPKKGKHEISNYWIKSALPDSDTAAKWRKGRLPVREADE